MSQTLFRQPHPGFLTGHVPKRGDELANASVIYQAAERVGAAAGAVVDDGEVLCALQPKRLEELSRQAGITKTAQQDGGAVKHIRHCFLACCKSLVDHGPHPITPCCLS